MASLLVDRGLAAKAEIFGSQEGDYSPSIVFVRTSVRPRGKGASRHDGVRNDSRTD